MAEAVTRTTPGTGDGAEIDPSVIENMRKVKLAAQSGQPYDLRALMGDDAPPLPEPQPVSPPDAQMSSEAIVAARPAELATVPPPPGLDERGWSIEVTSRHPVLLAQAMEELIAEGPEAWASGDPPVDPTDAVSLRKALSDIGFAEVFKNNLLVGAARRNSDKLARAVTAASYNTEPSQAAAKEALAEAKAAAEGASPAPSGTPKAADKPPASPAPHRPSGGASSSSSKS